MTMNVIVAMMDGSEYGRWALDWVAQLPFVERPRVTVVHVMDSTALRAPFLPLSVVTTEKAYLQEELDRMEAQSAKIISTIKQQLAALKLKGTVLKEQGAIAPEILKHVPKQDGLLVVGSKGVDTLHRFMLGSVSTNLLSYATCPVLVVKEEAAPVRRIILAPDGSVAWAIRVAGRAESRSRRSQSPRASRTLCVTSMTLSRRASTMSRTTCRSAAAA